MKREILNLMYRARAFEPVRLANSGKALVLHYHRFSLEPKPAATLASVFEAQLAYLTRHYEIVPLRVIAGCLARRAPLPRRALAITVDDGYRDFYEVAHPILQKFKASATIFIVADFVDRKCWIWTDKVRYLLRNAADSGRTVDLNTIVDLDVLSRGGLDGLHSVPSGLAGERATGAAGTSCLKHEGDIASAADRINSGLKSMPESQRDYAINILASRMGVSLPPDPPDEYAAVSWDQLRELSSCSVEVGSHSMTHPILIRESNERVRYEVNESKSKIERLTGCPVNMFCYPNGDYEKRTVLEARRARYLGAVTCRDGLNSHRESQYELRRVHTVDEFARFLQRTSGLEQMKQAIRQRGRTSARGIKRRYETAE